MPTPRAEGSTASMPASWRTSQSRGLMRRRGRRWLPPAAAVQWTTMRWPSCSSWTLRSAVHSREWPRILSEALAAGREPLALLLRPGIEAPPAAVAALAARALIGPSGVPRPFPGWLAPHQELAARRLDAILDRYGGALLADAVGL